MCNVSQGLIEKGERRGLIEGEKRGLIEGEKRGLIEGEKRGRIEGRLEGEKRGRIEGEKRGRIAAYMDVGMSVEDIAERLGISVEEVRDIALERR